jgi:predicted DNA-binding transcriptional regulator AlpA
MTVKTTRDVLITTQPANRDSERIENPAVESKIAPRLLNRNQAAAYCCLSVQGFDRWVRVGRLPAPIGGTTRWDLKAVDAALDLASGLSNSPSASPLDQWRAKRARPS